METEKPITLPAAQLDPGSGSTALDPACFCITLDERQLEQAIANELGSSKQATALRAGWSNAFAQWPVFISQFGWQSMAAVVDAVEQVVALPAWREEALRGAPAIARHPPQGAAGVFFGYDFHVNGDRIGLIEINTNAGGALINALLARAQRKCCATLREMQPTAQDAERFEHEIVEMFRTEWRAARQDQPLRCIALVDSAPASQYLYPEFLLFEQLFARHGIRLLIADPAQLAFKQGVLHCGDAAIDLVYNRLTDFYLEAPESAALRAAYLQDAVVLTPHPQAHALYADKRRLVTLSDAVALQRLGVPEAQMQLLLAAIPRTELLTPENATGLWERRRQLFFKPVSGFGGRAAYRGEKLTKRAWSQISAGGYVAQELVVPGLRATAPAGPDAALKFDVRLYVYERRIQWTAARLYQGQTTNFRTAGGGFAPVYTLPPGGTAPACELEQPSCQPGATSAGSRVTSTS